MSRSKVLRLNDALETTKVMPANRMKAFDKSLRMGRPKTAPAYEGLSPPWAGAPIPQGIYCKAHNYNVIKVPHDDALPWPHCRAKCETPHARVPHDKDILAMNAELVSLVNACESMDPQPRPHLSPERVPKRHPLESRAQLIEDRCKAFENRWWDDENDNAALAHFRR